MSPDAPRLPEQMRDRLAIALSGRAGPLGLAVSGGGDSMALLHMAAQTGLQVRAVTVNHRLRPEADDEAALVARICATLGVPHDTLHWSGWDGRGNLPDQARRARYGLMADWAIGQGIGAVCLAHTRDDQAETFLLRLARSAGIDGLAAMSTARQAHGIIWLRPLLAEGRDDLRLYLRGVGLPWCEDPSNADPDYDRVKMRQALAVLAPLGIDAPRLASVAGHLAQARDALDHQVQEAARAYVRLDRGEVRIDRAAYLALPDEIARRLLVHTLTWTSSAEYGPRAAALGLMRRDITAGRDATLHGCHVIHGPVELRIVREWQAVRRLRAHTDQPWDRRWRLSGPENNGLLVQALGAAGLADCPGWRDTGLSRAGLLASPSVWDGARLVAAPLAGKAANWTVSTIPDDEEFFLSILSH